MKHKLLIVSWGVYPSTGGSSIIVNNLSEGFSADELVIVGQRPGREVDRPWSSFSNVELHYLDPQPFNITKGQKYSRWLTASKSIKQLKNMILEKGITHVLAIFPDEYFCYIAYRAAMQTKVSFNIWFHNSYLENRTGILKVVAQRLQPKFFAAADTVFVMSDGLNREMSRQYPEQKFVTLVHGFKAPPASEVDLTINPAKVKFLYSGSLNDSCLDASLRMLRVLMSRSEFETHIFSGNPQAFKQHGIGGDNIIFRDFIPVDDFMAQLNQYDVMLLPHGIDGLRSEFEYKTIFPTRTIPLLSSGKPILAHSPEGSFLTDFLRENDCAVIVTEKDEGQILKAIDEMLSDQSKTKKLIANAKLAARQFDLHQVAARLRKEVLLDDA